MALRTWIQGDSGYEMVYSVSFDDAVEKKAADEAGFPIDGCGAAAGESPSSSFVVRNGRIRVLEECICNLIRSAKLWRSTLGIPTKPVIHPQIRNNIPHGNTAPLQYCSRKPKFKVAQCNVFRIFRIKRGGSRG